MEKNSIFAAIMLLTSVIAARASAAEPGLLRTAYSLDEGRGYCLDIAGFGPNARVDEALQVHTCKYGAELGDQLFARSNDGSKIEVSDYGRCLTAGSLEPGAELFARECAATETQLWRFEWGHLSPASRSDLCVTLADGGGEIAGTPVLITPVYQRRSVVLDACADAAYERQSFRFGSPSERRLSTADVVRTGLPVDVAKELKGFGLEFNGEIARATFSITSAIPRSYEKAEVEVVEDVAYGPDERQRLDIRKATVRNAETPVPVIVMFHGGGLVGGSKQATAGTADYFASLGFIGVNANYRLAPDHPWPAGPQDVGRAVTWLHDNIADYGGDPDKIFVLGISSGALHSAGYALRADLMPPGTVRAAGAILMSGPYTFDFSDVGPNQIAYYGDDASLYAERVVVGNVTSTDIPLMFTTAEWDPPRYKIAFAQLLHEIVTEHGIMPRYHQSIGHNHESQRTTLGTAETNVAVEIIDFVQQTSGEH
jgi:arylformamidase